MEPKETTPDEQPTLPIEKDNQLADTNGRAIENEKDVHEIEAGNTGETEAKKDLLNGPAIDLVSQPKSDDE